MKRNRVVRGSTAIIPLVGHPVAQVKTPGPMNAWFAESGVDAVVVPVDVKPERAADFFDMLRALENCVGCSVTLPHKQTAFMACHEVSARARHARAVNTIKRTPSGKLVGDMTDGLAMVAALARNGIDVKGRSVLLIGAGGAGTAIALELAEQGVSSLAIQEPDKLRKQALVTELQSIFPDVGIFDDLPVGHRIDIAINASTVGMKPTDPLPISIDKIADALIVADAVTKPAVTPWLQEALARGLRIQTGEEMAVAQLPIQLRYWRFDYQPDVDFPAKTAVAE